MYTRSGTSINQLLQLDMIQYWVAHQELIGNSGSLSQKQFYQRVPARFYHWFTTDLPMIYPKKIRPFLEFYLLKTKPRFTEDLLRIYPRFTQSTEHLPKAYRRFTHDLPKIQNLTSKTYPKCTENLPQILAGTLYYFHKSPHFNHSNSRLDQYSFLSLSPQLTSRLS